MRRLLFVLVLSVLAAGAVSGAALAKEGGVELSSTPVGKAPDEPWTPTLRLVEGSPELLAQAKPGIAVRNVETGERLTFDARSTDNPRLYDVRVVFPEAGGYTVEAYDGITGRAYEIGGQWLIQGPEAAPAPVGPPRSTVNESSFPVWPVAAGGAVLFLAALGAGLFFGRQRLGLSH
jgi:hypothetical protein